eukprot:1355187-Prymnesium_polylepis.1
MHMHGRHVHMPCVVHVPLRLRLEGMRACPCRPILAATRSRTACQRRNPDPSLSCSPLLAGPLKERLSSRAAHCSPARSNRP